MEERYPPEVEQLVQQFGVALFAPQTPDGHLLTDPLTDPPAPHPLDNLVHPSFQEFLPTPGSPGVMYESLTDGAELKEYRRDLPGAPVLVSVEIIPLPPELGPVNPATGEPYTYNGWIEFRFIAQRS